MVFKRPEPWYLIQFISLLGNYEYLLSQDDTVDEYDYHNNDILISKEVPQNKR